MPETQTSTTRPPEDFPRQMADDIDRTLRHRRAPPGTLRSRAEDRAKRAGERAWIGLKKRPSLGVIGIGGLAVAAAGAVGVGELALGIAAGLAAWQVLRKGKSVEQAIEDIERVEKP
jgi:methylmalonyl-CoA mutase N-terminal domain/subunit